MSPINNLIKQKDKIDNYFSFDLSAATDRLPLELQERILSIYTSKEYAKL